LGTIQIDSPFPPSDVLENLRARGREWRESAVPQDLKEVKAQTLDVKIEGAQFEIRWVGVWNPFFNPLCFGTVQPYGDGSRIRAGFKLSPRGLRLFGVYASLVIVTVLGPPSTFKWVFSASLAILLIFIALRRRGPEPMRARLIENLAKAARGAATESGTPSSTRKDGAHQLTLL
jgi:hypothetical protein